MATRFPAQTIEAVGACTRALAGRSTQAVDAEKVLLRSDAATLGGLRAVGDRLALRQRWHDDGAERRYRPTETPAKEIFDAIELARLDAIGALSLTGVAGNLLAHPGAERDGLRWLAFEVFSSCNPPTLKAELVAAVRASLPPALLDGLAELAGDLRNHSSFADAAAHWSRAASHHITSAVSASGNAQAFRWVNPSVEYGSTSTPTRRARRQRFIAPRERHRRAATRRTPPRSWRAEAPAVTATTGSSQPTTIA
jgi:hypothetical protein